jgi:hypothetical protein
VSSCKNNPNRYRKLYNTIKYYERKLIFEQEFTIKKYLSPYFCNSMELTARLFKVNAPISGEGKNGTWKKQEFVVETQEQYPKKVMFTVWNDKAPIGNIPVGSTIKVFFDAESREYNERWFTDLKVWKIESTNNSTVVPQDNIPDFSTSEIPPAPPSDDMDDDLPF